MLSASAAGLHAPVPTLGAEPGRLVLDLAGRRVELARAEAVRLRDAAAAEAGSSSAARDLSVLLDRVLARGHLLALRQGEVHTLTSIAAGLGLGELVARLAGPGG